MSTQTASSSDSGIHSVTPVRKPRSRRPKVAPLALAPEPMAETPVVEPSAPPVSDVAKRPTVKGGRLREPNGLLDEAIIAMEPRNRLATKFGAAFGGGIPVLTFFEAHYGSIDMVKALTALAQGDVTLVNIWFVIVLGGLIVSSSKVYTAIFKASGSKAQAVGSVLILEGVLTFSGVHVGGFPIMSVLALLIVMALNALASSTKLALDRTL